MSVKRHLPKALSLAAVAACGAALLSAPAHSAQPAAAPAAAPAAPAAGAVDLAKAKQTFESTCSGCHETTLATDQRHDRAGWTGIVEKMSGLGLSASDAQKTEIIEYLTATYPAPAQ